MSTPSNKIDFKALRAAGAARMEEWKQISAEVVNVPQGHAAFVPRDDGAHLHPAVATRGLATCVGLVVEGEAGVFFAHLDNTSEPYAGRIAGIALGLVGRLRNIWVSTSSQRLPSVDAHGNPEWAWRDFPAERIYRRLMGIFVDFPQVRVQTLELSDIVFTFATSSVTRSLPYAAGKDDRKPGVRYLGMVPTL